MTENTTAIRSYAVAKGYSQAAEMIHASPLNEGARRFATFLPIHLLIDFALEIYLKAWLLQAEIDLTALKKGSVGHQLQVLFDMARTKKLPTISLLGDLITRLDGPHARFEYRYMEDEIVYDAPDLQVVFAILSQLVDAVDSFVGASASRGLEVGH